MLTSLVGPPVDERAARPDYRSYLDLARRFLDAPEGSMERTLAGAALSGGLARDHGDEPAGRGGELDAVRARVRRRQGQPSVAR
jgi:hypothetical protein